jgi:TPR repeat protein
MKREFLAAVLAVGVVTAAKADVETGERAYLAANYTWVAQELSPLARQGNAEAQYLLGVMHTQRKGVTRDYGEAAAWYRAAANQGHGLAAFNLGFMYYYGAGEADNAVAQDIAQAAHWLKQAAAAGYGAAQALLGEIYYRGLGVPRNLVAAATLTLRAASQGFEGAQYTAGLMLYAGEGVERDLVTAYTWFAKLSDAGYPGASRNRDIVASALDEAQLGEARAKAEALRSGG